MIRLMLLAFACLMTLDHGANSLELWRKDLRSPENQAIIEKLLQQQQQQQQQAQQEQYQGQDMMPYPMPSYLQATAPLSAPALVNGIDNQVGTRTDSGSGPQVDLIASNEIARHVLHFAQSLANRLATNYRKTEVFSPLSIVSALALLMLGAKGRTYDELSSIFGMADSVKFHEQFGLMLRDVQQPTRETISPQRQLVNWREQTNANRPNRRYQRPGPHEVYLANGLFTQLGYTLNSDYRQVINQIYKSEVVAYDFQKSPAQSTHKINSWVEDNTNSKIIDIISSSIPQSTRMIMANALYFKAFWETDFIESATKPDNFYPFGEGSTPALRVQMMATGGNFPYHEDLELGCRIIGLPYRGNLSTMYIIQPMQSSVDRLNNLQQRLTADKFEEMIGKMYRRSALVALPKLHIVESVNLKTMLQSMGISGIFSSVESDLSLIATSPASSSASTERSRAAANRRNLGGGSSLQNLEAQRKAAAAPTSGSRSELIVEDIVHKVDFTVNEQGTEAAAATVTYLKKSGPDVLFRADTPFLMLVRHDPTKLILFYGRINEPPTAN